MPAASQTWRGATEVRRERMLSKFLVDEGLAMRAVCPLPPFAKRMAGRVRVGGAFSFRLRIFALPPPPPPPPPHRFAGGGETVPQALLVSAEAGTQFLALDAHLRGHERATVPAASRSD